MTPCMRPDWDDHSEYCPCDIEAATGSPAEPCDECYFWQDPENDAL